jgi:SAM-dependent methyltransferase
MTKPDTADFFDAYAHDFDAIYGGADTPVNRLISRLFRKSMRLRYLKTLAGCRAGEGRTALDIGCGPGHYSVALARMGLTSVWGIDFAPAMIELARIKAESAGVGEICRFINDDFLTYDFGRTFDYAILMGFMDYISRPRVVIERALSLADRRAFFSFPAAEGILAWQRRRRYRTRCELYMYRRNEIPEIFRGLKYHGITIEKLSRDYFVTVEISASDDI